MDSNISHDEFILTNNVPKEFDDIRKKSKIPMTNKNLRYIQNNVIFLFEMKKKHRK